MGSHEPLANLSLTDGCVADRPDVPISFLLPQPEKEQRGRGEGKREGEGERGNREERRERERKGERGDREGRRERERKGRGGSMRRSKMGFIGESEGVKSYMSLWCHPILTTRTHVCW